MAVLCILFSMAGDFSFWWCNRVSLFPRP